MSGAMMKNKSSRKFHEEGDFRRDDDGPYDDGFDSDQNDRDAAGVGGGFRSDSDGEDSDGEDSGYGSGADQKEEPHDTLPYEREIADLLGRMIGVEISNKAEYYANYKRFRFLFRANSPQHPVFYKLTFAGPDTEHTEDAAFWELLLQTYFDTVTKQPTPGSGHVKIHARVLMRVYFRHGFMFKYLFQVTHGGVSNEMWVFWCMIDGKKEFVLIRS